MSFRNQFFATAAACTLAVSAIPSNVAAQQTTPDGIRLDNAVNRPDRPYRPAGSSDQLGEGIPSAVQARLAGRALTAKSK